MGIRVVTDSACDLPDLLVDALRIEIVPLTIRFGSVELVDRDQLSAEEFWKRVEASDALPETAAPCHTSSADVQVDLPGSFPHTGQAKLSARRTMGSMLSAITGGRA